MNKLPSEKELNIIRGKMLVNSATKEELHDFLRYVAELEYLLNQDDYEDIHGTEGWKHRMGIE